MADSPFGPGLFQPGGLFSSEAADYGGIADLLPKIANAAAAADLEHRGQLGSADEGATLPNKDLAGDITALVTRAGELRGATAQAFSYGYVSELDAHVGALNLGVRALGVCAQAEAEIWSRARQVVLDTANQSVSAMRASAPKDDGSGFVIAMVVNGAVAAVASAGIGSAGLAVLVAGVAATASAAETLSGAFAEGEADPAPLDGDHPDVVRDHIRAALEELNATTREEEEKTQDIAGAFSTGEFTQLTPSVNPSYEHLRAVVGLGLLMTSKQLNEAAAVLWHAYLNITSKDAAAQEDLAGLQKKLDSGGSDAAPSTMVGAVLGAIGTGNYPGAT